MRKVIFILIFLLLGISLSSSPVEAKTYTIHTGSYSLDRHDLTQSEIDAQVQAIVQAIPNVGYIAIGTYLDYDQQIQMWSNAIHARGKKVFFRSAGFNAWQQRNGETYVMTPLDHRVWVSTFIRLHPTVFVPGDIFEAVPDEPEGGTYWSNTYGQGGVGANQIAKDEFNAFLQGSIIDVNTVFAEMGITGVATGYVFTNPSAAKDVIDTTTASLLVAIGTDDYPEIANGIPLTSVQECRNAMQNEIATWLLPAHPTKPKHITFGPSVYTQLTQKRQKDIYTAEFNVIFDTIPDLEGVTIWQAGANDNPKSRIFDYFNGAWSARSATGVINSFFTHI